MIFSFLIFHHPFSQPALEVNLMRSTKRGNPFVFVRQSYRNGILTFEEGYKHLLFLQYPRNNTTIGNIKPCYSPFPPNQLTLQSPTSNSEFWKTFIAYVCEVHKKWQLSELGLDMTSQPIGSDASEGPASPSKGQILNVTVRMVTYSLRSKTGVFGGWD